eukprot:scaffold211819_cov14-Tisochrysis_lutea.AAC.1
MEVATCTPSGLLQKMLDSRIQKNTFPLHVQRRKKRESEKSIAIKTDHVRYGHDNLCFTAPLVMYALLQKSNRSLICAK